jgi:hypothetical protein
MLFRVVSLALVLLLSFAAHGRGVSPYLPLQLSPEIERQIERLLILADRPVLTRPIAAATVFDALPRACERDAVLCEQVRRYLDGYMKSFGLSHASLAATGSDSTRTPIPNRRGMSTDSGYEASAQLYWQASDHLLVNAGFVAYDGDSMPTGSVLSIGFDFAQLDVGYREHWLSPMTDSAMLLSTQAATLPSVTLSNYAPLTRFGLRYELFVAQLSESSRIRFQDGFTTGEPKLAGLHLSIEPFPGWSLGFNRLLQFGGGERGGQSLRDVFDAFFRPSEFDNRSGDLTVDEEFGNQVASITSTFLVPGDLPFSVYFEYGGEDTSASSNYHLGNSALSAGLHFPALWRRFDLTVEASEWQNGWYVHDIYQSGLTNEANVIGHWGGDWRVVGDAVGARSYMARLGWQAKFGGFIEATLRTLTNESYTAPDYQQAHSLDVRYSRPWQEFYFGAELTAGRTVLGENYSRLGAFIRF